MFIDKRMLVFQTDGHLSAYGLGWIVEGSVACAHEEAAVVEAHLVVCRSNLLEGLAIQAVAEVGEVAATRIEVAVDAEIDLAHLALGELDTLHLFLLHVGDGLVAVVEAHAFLAHNQPVA